MAANDASTAAASAANAAAAAAAGAASNVSTDAVRSRDWMFCPVTGALLELDAERGVAWSPVSGFERRLEDLDSVSIVSKTDIHDYRRRYKLTPLGPDAVGKDGRSTLGTNEPTGGATDATSRVRSTVDEACIKCGHRGLEFYTMQLRSADEGSTVFYECPECQHTWNQNN